MEDDHETLESLKEDRRYLIKVRNELQDEVVWLQQKLNEMAAALKKYGAHDYICDKISPEGDIRSGDWPCTCGLSDILSQ